MYDLFNQYIELMLGRTAGFGDFKKYVIGEVMPIYKRLGFETRESDSFMDISLRELVVNTVCELGFEPCIKGATSLFKAWMESTSKIKKLDVQIKKNSSLIWKSNWVH
jgi:hypothetical protein